MRQKDLFSSNTFFFAPKSDCLHSFVTLSSSSSSSSFQQHNKTEQHPVDCGCCSHHGAPQGSFAATALIGIEDFHQAHIPHQTSWQCPPLGLVWFMTSVWRLVDVYSYSNLETRSTSQSHYQGIKKTRVMISIFSGNNLFGWANCMGSP